MQQKEFSFRDMVRESNRIENINRPPTGQEMREFRRFLTLKSIAVADLQTFVSVYQPNSWLRLAPNDNVSVGSYIAPQGGEKILHHLSTLLGQINSAAISAWQAHTWYEMLHPFIDGNGRSGRMLWYWMMRENKRFLGYGFLRGFYYQTLARAQEDEPFPVPPWY